MFCGYWSGTYSGRPGGPYLPVGSSMNNQSHIIKPTLIDLNSGALTIHSGALTTHYYPFIICMNSCNESCNTVEEAFY